MQVLKLQAVVHKATLGKLRKERESAAQHESATQKLAALRDALSSWDADTEANSEVRGTAVIPASAATCTLPWAMVAS